MPCVCTVSYFKTNSHTLSKMWTRRTKIYFVFLFTCDINLYDCYFLVISLLILVIDLPDFKTLWHLGIAFAVDRPAVVLKAIYG